MNEFGSLVNVPEFRSLNVLQRALLASDGTLTELLGAVFLETMDMVKCGQEVRKGRAVHSALECMPDDTVLERQIALRGRRSSRIYVYAESQIAVDRFGPDFRAALWQTEEPIGRLARAFHLESRRELLEFRGPHADIPRQFMATPGEFVTRTYRICGGGRPVAIITEHFPVTLSLPDREGVAAVADPAGNEAGSTRQVLKLNVT